MSVLIEMPMPETCGQCPLVVWERYRNCAITGAMVYGFNNGAVNYYDRPDAGRHPCCPLKEVKDEC